MQFKFQTKRSDKDLLSDKVYAAMETGNHGGAREVLANHVATFPEAVASIQRDVLQDYGVKL